MTKEFQKRYYITEKLAKDLTKLSSAMYAESHPELEINNPKPLFEALGIRKPLSMEEKIERLFRGPRGLIQQMYDQGEETPEEMNDLDIETDIEPISPHEFHVMAEERLANQQNEPEAIQAEKKPETGSNPNPDQTTVSSSSEQVSEP